METITENPRQQFAAMRQCLKNGIRIYPQPHGNRYKIIVERGGKQKRGKEIYPLKSDKTTLGVYDKIQELYGLIAEKLNKPVTNLI